MQIILRQTSANLPYFIYSPKLFLGFFANFVQNY